jgi:M6 family metalloprotease-like protein
LAAGLGRFWKVVLVVALAHVGAEPATAQSSVSPPTANQDRPGGDFFGFDLPFSEFESPSADGPRTCRLACAKHGNCRAYTFVRAGVQGPRARCYLKHRVPDAVSSACCSSGVRTGPSTQVAFVTAPHEVPYFDVLTGTDRVGSDYRTQDLPAGSTASSCQVLCWAEGRCRAFTHTRPATSGAAPRCWLKSAQPPATPCPQCTSGVKLGASHVGAGTFGYGVGADNAADPVRPLVVVLLYFTPPAVTNAFGPGQTLAYYDRLVFGPDEPNISSYFYEASGGRFAFVKGEIVGPLKVATLPVSTDGTRTLAKQLAASNGVKFSTFDRDGDGVISQTEATVLVIDNLSYGAGQTNENHCAVVDGQQNCAGVSLVGVNSGFSNIAHELAHTIQQWDNYGAAGTLGCVGQNMSLASCTVLAGGPSQNAFISVTPDPWHRMYWGWTQPLIVSLGDYGGCTVVEARQGGRGNTVLFFDPNRNTSEYYMAAFHNPALPSFRLTNHTNPTGATTLQQASSYDDDLPGAGVLFWWVQTVNKTPFNLPAGIGPAADGVLQSAASLAGDDVLGAVAGGSVVLAGPDGLVQTPLNPQDGYLSDMTLFPSYDPRTHRPTRWGAVPLLNNAESPVIRWLDGSVSSGFRVRVPAVEADARSAEVEWGTLQLRADGIRPTELRPTDTGFTVTGLFGVDDRATERQAVLRSRSSGRTYRLESVRWECNRVTFRRPAGLTPGDYDFEVQSSSDRNSNRVLLRVR